MEKFQVTVDNTFRDLLEKAYRYHADERGGRTFTFYGKLPALIQRACEQRLHILKVTLNGIVLFEEQEDRLGLRQALNEWFEDKKAKEGTLFLDDCTSPEKIKELTKAFFSN